MKLSERGAIKSAIADGGFHLYPAGKLIDIIKSGTASDSLTGDFNTTATIDKISKVTGPDDAASKELFEMDKATLCKNLLEMNAEYDIESVFDKVMGTIPALAKRYYGIDSIEIPRPKILEYYFEGISDIYKDADWSAFNVNSMESRELNVPVGIYFKRNQVTPGLPEFVVIHEANHVMQEMAASPEFHHYIPWMDEGFADILGRMMLFRATEDESLITKIKNSKTEVEVTDQWKKAYHFGEETAALILMRGRLPFLKAMMRARKNDPLSVDWNAFAVMIKKGTDPHIAILKAYTGKKVDSFRKKFEKDEKEFRGQADLDQTDLRIISMFLATQPPSCLSASEYKAALWFVDEVAKRPSLHFVDPEAIHADMRSKVNGWQNDVATPWSSITANVMEKSPSVDLRLLIKESEVPEAMREAANSLVSKYYVIRRTIGNDTYLEPYGGGLPYRIGSGEIRCKY